MEAPSQQLCDDLLGLARKIKSAMFKLAESHGLTPPQMSALYAIKRGEETMGKVACALHCDASNVTGIIDRLVEQDLVIRTECQQDRRAKTLELTAKGEKSVNELLSKLPNLLGCGNLTTTEQAALHSAVRKLTT